MTMQRDNTPLIQVSADVQTTVCDLRNERMSMSFDVHLDQVRKAAIASPPQHLGMMDFHKLFAKALQFGFIELGERCPSPEDFAKLLLSKHARYGASAIRAFGPLGVVIRIYSKYERWCNMTNTGRPDHEKWDTLVDIMGYAVLGDRLVQENLNKETR